MAIKRQITLMLECNPDGTEGILVLHRDGVKVPEARPLESMGALRLFITPDGFLYTVAFIKNPETGEPQLIVSQVVTGLHAGPSLFQPVETGLPTN